VSANRGQNKYIFVDLDLIDDVYKAWGDAVKADRS
jgi:hypothetical protein